MQFPPFAEPPIIPPTPTQLDTTRHLLFNHVAMHQADRQLKELGYGENRYMKIFMTIARANQESPTTVLEDLPITWTEWHVLCWAGLLHESPMPYAVFAQLIPYAWINFADILSAIILAMSVQRPGETPPVPATNGEITDPFPLSGTGDATGREPASAVA